MGKRKVIYLSGPIMDEHSGQAVEWRSRAKELLSDSFDMLDPMRRKFVDRQVDSANEIVEFDLQDVREADLILVNYNKPSIGTSMEVFNALRTIQVKSRGQKITAVLSGACLRATSCPVVVVVERMNLRSGYFSE